MTDIQRDDTMKAGDLKADDMKADDLASEIPRVNRQGKFKIGQCVRHRFFSFRGVIFDVDPIFSNTDEWWDAIPEQIRPKKDQPFYHIFAENEETSYIAYVSEQNLRLDMSNEPFTHPQLSEFFSGYDDESGLYCLPSEQKN